MTDWLHMFFYHEDNSADRTTVAKFNNGGKLIEYNRGNLWRFDSNFLTQVTKKALKSMML